MQQTQSRGGKSFVQRLGSYLSGMIMPNIGALIAWGILTALFIPDGFLPNEDFASMVGPMINYLIPILIAYQGGSMVHGQRGAVVGVIAVMGVILGAPEAPMLLGAMVVGPFGGYMIKLFDDFFGDKIPTGLEMLVNNFSSGIIGFILSLLAFVVIGPVFLGLNQAMAAGVEWIINANLLPLVNVFIEPAKVLFLNNAINHGIFTPLGAQQTAETGRSIIYLLEANPGPGLGILLSYMVFGKGSARSSSFGAVFIHFIGGIHEIYFPYVLMKPAMFLAAIAGGVAGTFTNVILGGALRSPASPGSIIAVLGATASGAYVAVISSVLIAAAASFAVGSLILKLDRSDDSEEALDAAIAKSSANKAQAKGQVTANDAGAVGAGDVATGVDAVEDKLVNKIIFACDAGMGSSAMGASLMKKKVKEADLNISVTNSSINNLQDEEGLLVITQEELTERASQRTPSAVHVSVDNFLGSPKYDEIINKIRNQS
ncbi:PTS mannitol transporter subunit IICB [Marinilactibacillus kalidii]|uniref:PTS mannitol transporter subunit IICB n=1 Tax=Marinilactibacillus kalidii TaxID=2820274 RepID=UPI001ABDCD95|nr:PTS mannitol transporter subunit IICB [Marinilactibacillus kalidii]